MILLFLLTVSSFIDPAKAQVPGLVHTESGYDTVKGEDAICWFAPRFLNETGQEEQDRDELNVDTFSGQNWRSGLVVPLSLDRPRCCPGVLWVWMCTWTS